MSSSPPPDPDAEEDAAITATTGGLDDSRLREALGMAVRRPPVALSAGQVIDDAYRIERPLGAGGMGAVYLARDLRLHRNVAIKVHTAVAGEPGGERLLREAAAMAQLVHAHVVTVYEVGTWAGHPYVAMEYVQGGTARSWLAAAPRTIREILAAFVAAGRGLAAAHAVGLVHRDFKPDNVLVGDDGRIRVADFGLARGFDETAGADAPASELPLSQLTATGGVVGTPAYMAPEQRRPGKIGPAADQFAFAVALWEALCGDRPFAGTTDAQLVAAIAGGALRTPPPQRRIPAHVVLALTRALSREPAARFPSVDALLAELTRDPGARRRQVALIAGIALGVIALGAVVLLRRDDPDARAARTCDRAGERIAETWTPARRAAIAQAFADTHRSHAATTAAKVGDRLEAYATAWGQARVAACHAHRRGEQSAQVSDLRDHCLDRRRAELGALVDVLEHVDAAAVDRAIDATLGLGELADCEDVPRLTGAVPQPTDAAAVEALAEAEARLAEARALNGAGRFADGLTAAQAAVTAAERAGYAPVTGEARMWLGYLHVSGGDPVAARAAFDLAAGDAAAAHDDALAAEIWTAVFQVTSTKLEQLAEAEKLLPYVEAALVRAGSPPKSVAGLARARGMLLARQGKFDEAAPLLARALALFEETHGPVDTRVAMILNLQGGVLREQGDFPAARAAFERALEILQEIHGGEHPQIAATLNNLAGVALTEGRSEDARVAFERTIAMKERLLGLEHPELASSLTNLSTALIALDRAAEAVPHLERARALTEAKYGPDHPSVGRVLGVLAKAEVALGDLVGARAHLAQARAVLEPAFGLDHPEVAEVLAAIATIDAMEKPTNPGR